MVNDTKTRVSSSGFKEKIKKIFKNEVEKDLEEEPNKKFENVKLFELTRKNLFFCLILFLFIVNILVGFNLNFLYSRQVLGFLFLILIPGLLLMLCFRIKGIGFWEYLVYIIGLSISFIIFGGLSINWILPFLSITDKPLSLYPILICFDIFFIILGIIAWKRNKGLYHKVTVPKLDSLNNIFFIIPMTFPILSVLGAFFLNNHGSNILTMIMLGAVAVYFLMLVIFRKKLNENVFPWALYFIALAFLLMYSMRSWFIAGFDVNGEIKVAQLVLLNNHWSMSLFQDAYNACLSLAIFSPIIKIFLNIKIDLVFKLIIQILFSTLPVILYVMYKKIINKRILIFLACFFFISQIFFITQMPALIRQEVAYLFFALFFLVLFSEKIAHKTVLLIIFGFSVIVSHYSTSYIFLFTLFMAYVISIVIRKVTKNKKGVVLVFSLTLLLILLIFGFLWTSQITQVSSGLTTTVQNTVVRAGQVFNQESRSEIIQNLLFKQIDYSNIFQNYSSEISNQYQNNTNLNLLSGDNTIEYVPPSVKGINNYRLYGIFSIINSVASFYFKILIALGIFISIIFIKDFKRKDYFIYTFVLFLVTLLIAILPYISLDYNFERIYLQTLIFLSLPAIYAGYKIFNLVIKEKNISLILVSILLIIFLIFSSLSIPFLFTGGIGGSLTLQNYGDEFNHFYTTNSDVKSLLWINSFSQKNSIFYFDRYSKLMVFSILPNFSQKIFSDVNSETIDKSSYVFASSSDYMGVSTVEYNGILFNIGFPNQFLNDNKNKIYNNGNSQVFK